MYGILSVVTAFHDVSDLIGLEEVTCIPWLGRGSSLSPGMHGQGNLLTHLCLEAILQSFSRTCLRRKPIKMAEQKEGRN